MGEVVHLEGRIRIVRTPEQVVQERQDQEEQARRAASRANLARQRAQRLRRNVPWANRREIERFYLEAGRLTRRTGIVHEVDHIIPLQGEMVSGLHVETNLQVIPKADNRAKSNRYEEVGGS